MYPGHRRAGTHGAADTADVPGATGLSWEHRQGCSSHASQDRPLEKSRAHLSPLVPVLHRTLGSFPSTPLKAPGARDTPGFNIPLVKLHLSHCTHARSRFGVQWGVGAGTSSHRIPSTPHSIRPLINQPLAEIRWEVSVNQLQTIKSLAKLLSCYSC